MADGLEIAIRAEAELGEGPTWDPERQRLLWVDILSCRIHLFEPGSGRRAVIATEQHVGAVKPRAAGGLVVNLRDGVGLYDEEGAFSWLRHAPVPGRRGNEAMVAPDGALWAGSMRYDEGPGGGTLDRVAPDGRATTVLPEVTTSNGTGWSPDGARMYYIDTPTRRIDVFTVSDGGRGAVDRRTFADVSDLAGFPDGLAVDAAGNVWVAFWEGGAVHRFTPEGKRDHTLTVPASRPTSCAFGGPGLTDLYITTARIGIDTAREPLAGSVFVVPDAGRGLPQPPFAG